jgi:hypothetical protein
MFTVLGISIKSAPLIVILLGSICERKRVLLYLLAAGTAAAAYTLETSRAERKEKPTNVAAGAF